MKFLSPNVVIEDYIDFTDHKGSLDRSAMKKIANAVIRKLDPPSDYVHKIKLIDVEDYRAIAPDDTSAIIQMAFREESTTKVRRVDIVEWTEKLYDGSKCEVTITKDCPKCHQKVTECSCESPEVVYDVDRIWELSHPEYKYGHMKHYYRHGGLTNDNQWISPYHPEFILMKYSHHSFFNADSHVPGCLNLNTQLMANAKVEYTFDDPIIDVSREKGKILISYLALRLDKEGYRMIPDVEEVFEAIKWAIIEMMSYREMGKAVTQAERSHYRFMYQDAKAEKIRTMGMANEVLNTPQYEHWRTFLEQNLFKVLKDFNNDNYYGATSPDIYGITMDRLTNHK